MSQQQQQQPVQVVFGGGIFMSPLYNSGEKALPLLHVLREVGVDTIDLAANYPGTEKTVGEAISGVGQEEEEDKLSEYFTIDTKISGGLGPEPATEEVVVAMGEESLRKLGVGCVDILYLHAPDPRVPLISTLRGIQRLYDSGKFRRFGLSNFLVPDVIEVLRICDEELSSSSPSQDKKKLLRPTVYQGNYSAVARLAEDDLLPLLRREGVAFYAYSPIAGGFLTKKAEDFVSSDEKQGPGQHLTGRWNPAHPLGTIYRSLYGAMAEKGLARWNEIAGEEGISGAEMAYRWVVCCSALGAGDKVVVGARTAEQIREVMGWVGKGPLSERARRGINEVWDEVKGLAPRDNVNDFLLKKKDD